jgi:hypothetical protein
MEGDVDNNKGETNYKMKKRKMKKPKGEVQ